MVAVMMMMMMMMMMMIIIIIVIISCYCYHVRTCAQVLGWQLLTLPVIDGYESP